MGWENALLSSGWMSRGSPCHSLSRCRDCEAATTYSDTYCEQCDARHDPSDDFNRYVWKKKDNRWERRWHPICFECNTELPLYAERENDRCRYCVACDRLHDPSDEAKRYRWVQNRWCVIEIRIHCEMCGLPTWVTPNNGTSRCMACDL